MKKQILLASCLFFLLPSCEIKQPYVVSFSSPFMVPQTGDGTIIKENAIVSPFHTDIKANYYTYAGVDSKEKLDNIKSYFEEDLLYYHALSDHHYSYQKNHQDIINIKYLNEHKEEKIKVDPYLYSLLKEAFTFTLQSEGRFNMFLGELSSLYEEKYENVEKYSSNQDEILSKATHLHFNRFSKEEKDTISSLVYMLPQTVEEFSSLLDFEDETNSVTFHNFIKDGKVNHNLQISLGGCAKGFATEQISKDLKETYRDLSMIINSGNSSIKAIGTRPDQVDWSIRYFNPCFRECLDGNSSFNENELVLTQKGDFTLSTSGAYENYFYEYIDNNYIRRDHILDSKTGYSKNTFDQVSVFSFHAGIADMYSTALMNTSSLDEATALLSKLDAHYSFSTNYLFSYKQKKESDERENYPLSCYSPLSSLNLPISTLTNHSSYSGDYQDILLEEIQDIQTKREITFNQTYFVSENLLSKTSMETKLKHPLISKIKTID